MLGVRVKVRVRVRVWVRVRVSSDLLDSLEMPGRPLCNIEHVPCAKRQRLRKNRTPLPLSLAMPPPVMGS